MQCAQLLQQRHHTRCTARSSGQRHASAVVAQLKYRPSSSSKRWAIPSAKTDEAPAAAGAAAADNYPWSQPGYKGAVVSQMPASNQAAVIAAIAVGLGVGTAVNASILGPAVSQHLPSFLQVSVHHTTSTLQLQRQHGHCPQHFAVAAGDWSLLVPTGPHLHGSRWAADVVGSGHLNRWQEHLLSMGIPNKMTTCVWRSLHTAACNVACAQRERAMAAGLAQHTHTVADTTHTHNSICIRVTSSCTQQHGQGQEHWSGPQKPLQLSCLEVLYFVLAAGNPDPSLPWCRCCPVPAPPQAWPTSRRSRGSRTCTPTPAPGGCGTCQAASDSVSGGPSGGHKGRCLWWGRGAQCWGGWQGLHRQPSSVATPVHQLCMEATSP